MPFFMLVRLKPLLSPQHIRNIIFLNHNTKIRKHHEKSSSR
nr:MAG TPA: hypothetical protein [Bacteriophage sp.]